MATLTATTSKHATLTAATVDKVTFSSSAPAYEIVNLGTTDIYVRYDGVDPAVAADETDLVRGGEYIVIRPEHLTAEIRLISSGTAEYHISRVAS